MIQIEELFLKIRDANVEVTLEGGHNYSIMTTHENALYYGSNWNREVNTRHPYLAAWKTDRFLDL